MEQQVNNISHNVVVVVRGVPASSGGLAWIGAPICKEDREGAANDGQPGELP